jgi:hypothetical protein
MEPDRVVGRAHDSIQTWPGNLAALATGPREAQAAPANEVAVRLLPMLTGGEHRNLHQISQVSSSGQFIDQTGGGKWT